MLHVALLLKFLSFLLFPLFSKYKHMWMWIGWLDRTKIKLDANKLGLNTKTIRLNKGYVKD